jgi:hypothetical protein
MKKFFFLSIIVISFACQKGAISPPSVSDNLEWVSTLLKDSLSTNEYDALDFSKATEVKLSNGHLLTKISYKQAALVGNLLFIEMDQSKLISSKRLQIMGKVDVKQSGPQFNGSILIQGLDNKIELNAQIANGKIQSSINQNIKTNSEQNHIKSQDDFSNDFTLPEVMVSSTYSNGSWGYSIWGNIYYLLNMGSKTNYECLLLDFPDGIIAPPAPSEVVDVIDIEKDHIKDSISPKKMTNCFSTISNLNASFKVTIKVDIPMDNHPESFFSLESLTPGHVFLEVEKKGYSGEIISQEIGFYPVSKAASITGMDVDSKLVDNAGHEMNAAYSVYLNSTQFEAVLQAINKYGNTPYNIRSFNCADYALAVMRSAGIQFNVPKYQIPVYYLLTDYSNTPQGVYAAIEALCKSGNLNAFKFATKQYAGNSHGPCN